MQKQEKLRFVEMAKSNPAMETAGYCHKNGRNSLCRRLPPEIDRNCADGGYQSKCEKLLPEDTQRTDEIRREHLKSILLRKRQVKTGRNSADGGSQSKYVKLCCQKIRKSI